jgi:C_GCAxxG_C_C family probable redox protein
MNKQEKARKLHHQKFNCSQSVLATFGNEYGVSEDICLRISCAFGGGMGRQQDTCGAVTGALMVLGLKYGKSMNYTEEKKPDTYIKTREFFRMFKKLHGSTNCRELLGGLDLNDPEDYKKIIDGNLFEAKCGKYITDAVAIVEELTS